LRDSKLYWYRLYNLPKWYLWEFCVETKHFNFVLDAESLRILLKGLNEKSVDIEEEQLQIYTVWLNKFLRLLLQKTKEVFDEYYSSSFFSKLRQKLACSRLSEIEVLVKERPTVQLNIELQTFDTKHLKYE